MAKMVIIVDEVFRDKVLAAFESFQIQYRIAGYPNGSVVVHETFESKINSMPVEKPKEKTTLKKVVAPIIDKRDEVR
ncbi:hypothetical protein R5O24_02895 [Tenacibaculum maritimum]|uniref:hypothetical protein n=1 Tax=Tenacibaculum maritimum TaxID=107401 RepID=UPI00388D3DC6